MLVLFLIHLLTDALLSFVVLPYIISFHNLFSFSVPPLVFLSINFLYVKANFSVVIENQHEPARSSPRFYDDLPVLPNERLSLICFKSPRL